MKYNNDTLAISLVQFDIVWEDKEANLCYIENIIPTLEGKTDIIVLPEMFSTGFTMKSREMAEPFTGKTVVRLKQLAEKYNIALCGSYIASDNGQYYNRGFFISAEDVHYYDKRHLFRLGDEPQFFSAGKEKVIFRYKGFNICLLVCYDLRFPVWSRNIANEYDLLIYVANWPASRFKIWNSLLTARAIENLCYVCGVNRTGADGYNLNYLGESQLIDAKGDKIIDLGQKQNEISTVYISKKKLEDFRLKFPVWKDADKFELK